MSSATSTDEVPLERVKRDPTSLQPWQFFVLAALACATAVTFLSRGQGLTPVILLTVLMGTTAFVGLAVLRTVLPLVTAQEDRTAVIGQRTRAALEREKMLALRALKDLEFDRAMGKLSEEDFHDMSGRLRMRAARLMRQLDAGAGYRDRVERDLAKRLGEKASSPEARDSRVRTSVQAEIAGAGGVGPLDSSSAARTCVACSTANDIDARFCKGCGAKL
jgi:hypothetical protein